ncbi:radical SAM protein [candidate division WOR-3 bacterium]|nr:radical SAM protein [candidate division WOR-3 bacterium]
MNLFDPISKAKEIGQLVIKDNERMYYRIPRTGKWYGGIATADCCGCNLKCVFCWSNKPRDYPEKTGKFYSPEQVFNKISNCARINNYRLLRISGNEPTIAKEHLLKVLSLNDKTKYLFILETNGTLLNEEFVIDLSKIRNLHVRVSLKGTNPEEFSMLTSAIPQTFDMIMDNLKLLIDYKIRFNLAVMLSFSPDKNIVLLKQRLKKISKSILDDFEEEYIFLYPHVVNRLKKAGIKPLIAYTPGGIPKKLI